MYPTHEPSAQTHELRIVRYYYFIITWPDSISNEFYIRKCDFSLLLHIAMSV